MKIIFELLFLLSSTMIMAQNDNNSVQSQLTVARAFTYDAAGNRINMFIPGSSLLKTKGKEAPSPAMISVDVSNTSEILEVKTDNASKILSVAIYSTSGQLVSESRHIGLHSTRLYITSLQKGVYVVDIETEKGHITRKINKE